MYRLCVSTCAHVYDFSSALFVTLHCSTFQLLLTQIYDSTFQSTLLDPQSLADLPNLDFIYGVEMFATPDEVATNENIPDGQYAPSEMILIVAMNRVSDITRHCRR